MPQKTERQSYESTSYLAHMSSVGSARRLSVDDSDDLYVMIRDCLLDQSVLETLYKTGLLTNLLLQGCSVLCGYN
jgi:hypothetical protein